MRNWKKKIRILIIMCKVDSKITQLKLKRMKIKIIQIYPNSNTKTKTNTKTKYNKIIWNKFP